MRDSQRLFLILIFGFIVFFSYQYVQGLFDRADVRKSIDIVKSYPPHGEPKLLQVIEARHEGEQDGPVQWTGEVKNTVFGHVIVHADVPLKGKRVARYEFGVNLTTVSIHPANPRGEEAIQELEAALPSLSSPRE